MYLLYPQQPTIAAVAFHDIAMKHSTISIKGVFVSFILEGKGGKGRGLKSSCEFILLFKHLPFPSLPSKIRTHEHTLGVAIVVNRGAIARYSGVASRNIGSVRRSFWSGVFFGRGCSQLLYCPRCKYPFLPLLFH